MKSIEEYLKQSKISYRTGKKLRSGTLLEKVCALCTMPFIMIGVPFFARKDKSEIENIEKHEHIFKLQKYNSITENGVLMYLPLLKSTEKSDILQSGIFFKEDFHEVEFLSIVKDKYLKAGMVILDIGANIGNHSVYFSKIGKAKKIYAFEPIKSTYDMLCKNIEINDLKDIVYPNNCAVGEGTGKAKVESYNPLNIGATHLSLAEESNASGTDIGGIQIISIDDFSIRDQVDFIKIDVEGFEVNVIKGMKQLLKKDKPILWIEIFQDNYQEMLTLLNELGYSMIEKLDEADYIFEYTR